MDFSEIDVPSGHPSDVDMWYITPSGFVIIGEIKNVKGTFTSYQKRLLARFVDGMKNGGTVLYIIHDKDVHMGDRKVNVADCLVQEYYWNGRWIEPKIPTTVNTAIKKIMEEQNVINTSKERRI